jgi:hypothetical protein
MGQKNWGYQQISPYNKDEFYALLLRAAPVYADAQYRDDARAIHPDGGNNIVTEISYNQ